MCFIEEAVAMSIYLSIYLSIYRSICICAVKLGSGPIWAFENACLEQKLRGSSQTYIYPVLIWSLEVPWESCCRPQPQYWIKCLDPWVKDFIQCWAGVANSHRESAGPPNTSTGQKISLPVVFTGGTCRNGARVPISQRVPPAGWNLHEACRFSHRSWRELLWNSRGGKPWKANPEKVHQITRCFFSPFTSLISREKLCVNRKKSAPRIHHFFTVSFSPFTSSWEISQFGHPTWKIWHMETLTKLHAKFHDTLGRNRALVKSKFEAPKCL